MTLNIVNILGSIRPGRMVDRVAKLLQKQMENKGIKPIVMDPLEICKHELVPQPLHFLPNPNQVPDWMKKAHEMIKKADGFFVLTSEYNCGIPPAVPNLLNSFPPASYRHKPVGIIIYSQGPFGGMRALTVLRPFLNELGLVSIPCYVPIPTVQTLIDENGNTSSKMVTDKIDQAVLELEWYAKGLKELKQKKAPPIIS